MRRLEGVLVVLGWVGLISSSLVMYVTWYTAFSANGEVIVYINRYNEMWSEFLLISFVFIPCGCFVVWKQLKRFYEGDA